MKKMVGVFVLFFFFTLQLSVSTGFAANSSCFSIKTPVLSLGAKDKATNQEVTALQKHLSSKGFLSVTPTGYYGKLTTLSVKAYQRSVGITETGNVGPLTRAQIARETCSTDTVRSTGNISVPTPSSVKVLSVAIVTCTKEIQYCPNGTLMPRDLTCSWRSDKCSTEMPLAIPPRIFSVETNLQGLVTIKGEHLSLSENTMQIDGKAVSYPSKGDDSVLMLYASEIPFTVSLGNHTAQVLNARLGNSSRFPFSFEQGISIASPILTYASFEESSVTNDTIIKVSGRNLSSITKLEYYASCCSSTKGYFIDNGLGAQLSTDYYKAFPVITSFTNAQISTLYVRLVAPDGSLGSWVKVTNASTRQNVVVTGISGGPTPGVLSTGNNIITGYGFTASSKVLVEPTEYGFSVYLPVTNVNAQGTQIAVNIPNNLFSNNGLYNVYIVNGSVKSQPFFSGYFCNTYLCSFSNTISQLTGQSNTSQTTGGSQGASSSNQTPATCSFDLRLCPDGSRMSRDATCAWRSELCPVTPVTTVPSAGSQGSSPTQTQATPSQSGVSQGSAVCTLEIKLCPDGSRMPRDATCAWRVDQCSSSQTGTLDTSSTPGSVIVSGSAGSSSNGSGRLFDITTDSSSITINPVRVYEGGTTTVTWTSTGQYCEASPNPFGLAETLPRHGTKIIGPIASSSPISFTCYTEAAGGLRALYSKSIFIVDPMTVPVTSSIPDCTDVLDRSICFSSNGMLRVPSLYIQSPDTLSKCTDALGSGTMCIDVNDNVHIPIASSPTPGATLSRCSSMATGTYACVDINSKVHLPVSTTSTSIAKCEDAFGQKSICVDGIGGIQFSATLIPTSYSPTSGCKVLGGKATCLNAPVLPGINIPIPLFPKIWGASTVCTDIASNIHRGSEGEETKKLQTFLMTIGLLDESPTAFYGDKTVQAVKEYQSSRGLPNTGMVYDFTRALIKKESCGE